MSVMDLSSTNTGDKLPQHQQISSIGGTPVYQFAGSGFIGWKSGMNVDADGSPHAYSPDGSPPGLDYLANAGSTGDWWGIVTQNGEEDGEPVIQGADDPAPGFYVSCTSLQDTTVDFRSPAAWVDSETIPFIVLPGGHEFGGHMGDVATVVRLDTGVYCHAIAADVGPSDQIGEGSIALADALGINSSPKNGGVDSGIGFLFYPGSGTGRPLTVDEINALADPLFQQACAAGALNHLQQAPDSDWSGTSTSPVEAPASPVFSFDAQNANPQGPSLQEFLNQFPGVSLTVDGVLGREVSDAMVKVLGFPLSGDPGPVLQGSTGPWIVYDPKNRTDYAKLLESFLGGLPGVSLEADGLAGQHTSDAAREIFGHRLAGDPRDGAAVAPGIPCDPEHFSTYAAQLQEFLGALPGITLKADGYPGTATSDALLQVLGIALPESPASP